METEVYNNDIDIIMRYYGTSWQDEADFPMNFLLIDIGNDAQMWSGTSIQATVLSWMQNMPQSRWPNWVVSDFLFRCGSSLVFKTSHNLLNW